MKNLCAMALLALLPCCLYSCESDDGGVTELAQKATLTLKSYYGSSGTLVQTIWSSTDRAGMMVAGDGVSEAGYASPLTTGGSSSLFVFALSAEQGKTATLVGFYPDDLDIGCSGGVLEVGLPASQDGSVTPCLIGSASATANSYSSVEMDLSQLYCAMYITIQKGNYSIVKAEITANGGEALAGDISLDLDSWTATASEKTVTVVPSSAIDCTEKTQTLAAMLAPVTLSSGYTVTLYTAAGDSFTVADDSTVALSPGGKVETDPAAADAVTKLAFCGDNLAYIINADIADETGFSDAILWSWDATSVANIIGLSSSRCNHLDDCKPVDNNTKMLFTSSYGFCVLIDIETKNVLFYSTSCSNAHSAELLPDDRIVVACSTGDASTNNCIQLYDANSSNRVLYSAALTSAHGVVWNDTTQRLYAIGGQTMQVYSLVDWDSSSPSLKLEQSVSTPKSGLHDLTYVDSNTLCVSGNGSYLYTIGNNTFSQLTLFSSCTALKSVNYNSDNGEVWYTDATVPEGNEDWSTHTLRHAASGNAATTDRTINVSGLDCYKMRVLNW